MLGDEEGSTTMRSAMDDVEVHVEAQLLVGSFELMSLVDWHLGILIAVQKE